MPGGQRGKGLGVVVLAEVLHTQPDCLLLPAAAVPGDAGLGQLRAVIAVQRHKPDGIVEARAPGLQGDDLDEVDWKELFVELVPQPEAFGLVVILQS